MIKRFLAWLKSIYYTPVYTTETPTSGVTTMSDVPVEVATTQTAPATDNTVTAEPTTTDTTPASTDVTPVAVAKPESPTVNDLKTIFEKLEHPVIEVWDEVVALAKKYL